MQIYTTSGTAAQYVYEDNTVMPDYYYEYKVDVYGGDDGSYQHALTDIGFCQARGVLSGAVHYGTGTAVSNVRINLIPTDDDTAAPRTYSKRIDGPSTGIQWQADSAQIASVFGADYTLQMFIRPDNDLKPGAVIASIPGVGHLTLGTLNSQGYPIYINNTTASILSPLTSHLPPLTYSLLTIANSQGNITLSVNYNTADTISIVAPLPVPRGSQEPEEHRRAVPL